MRSKRIAIWERRFREKPKLCLDYGEKARGFYEKGKGNNYLNTRKKFLLVLISQGRKFYACKKLSYFLGIRGSASSKECL